MARVVEIEANTVEEAIEAALSELGVPRENVDIELLDEGSRGFFGRVSSKARVRVSVIETGAAKAVALLEAIMDNLGIQGEVSLYEEDESIKVSINGQNIGLLIGKRGETLASLQAIANVVMRKAGMNKKLELDIENYRERRAESLKEIAERAATKAISSGRPIVLRPMNSYERRVVHVALQDNDKVITISEGEEPSRQVRITPKQ